MTRDAARSGVLVDIDTPHSSRAAWLRRGLRQNLNSVGTVWLVGAQNTRSDFVAGYGASESPNGYVRCPFPS